MLAGVVSYSNRAPNDRPRIDGSLPCSYLNGSEPKSRGNNRGECAGVILGVEIGDDE